MRVILILADGMRPDALEQIPSAKRFTEKSMYTFAGQTVFPSVTLPCHMSLFHSVDPERHGTTTNTYMPQVRPIYGIFEELALKKKKCAMFYDWEELRDVSLPGALAKSIFLDMQIFGHQKTDDMLTEEAIHCLRKDDMDFIFLYLGAPDAFGHNSGWMSDRYMQSVQDAWKNIDKVMEVVTDEDYVFITADHGGHDRTHGMNIKEDMEIPFFMAGPGIEAGMELPEFNIKDIAPTVLKLFDIAIPQAWEGKTLI